MTTARIDITGQRFGRLVAIKDAGTTAAGKAEWSCLCDCGTTKVVRGDSLRRGATRSCGSHTPRNRTHGMHGTRIYRIWLGMVRRCSSPKATQWPNYGGRGIKVCERWRKFEGFYADMGPAYRDGLTIDRIDPDGNYEPGNCAWATDAQQRRGQRRNVRLTWRDHTLVAADWARMLGVRRNLLYSRLAAGWPIEKALTEGIAPEVIAAALAGLRTEQP